MTMNRSPRRAALAFIFVTIALDIMAIGLVVPVLPKLVEDFMHEDTAAAARVFGVFGAVWALMQFISMPIMGSLSDRFGRRPVILGSLFGTTVAYGILIVADTMTLVYVSRFLAGFFAASLGTAQAVVTDLTPPSQRARGMGMLGAALGIGFVIGPAVGGLLGAVSPRLPFAVVMAVSFLNLVAAAFVLPESRPGDGKPLRLSDLPRLLIPTPLRVIGPTPSP